MTYPRDKQDLTAIAGQRDQIGRMLRQPDPLPKKPPQAIPARTPERVPGSTPASLGTEAQTDADSPLLADVVGSGEAEPDPAVDLDPDPDINDPPELSEAPLAELLLWRLGVPRDRVRMQQARHVDAINLTPPITTRKVADAIAQISLRIMNGELDASSAKTSLYALQTLLTALRLQIVEEKKAKDAKKKKSKSRGRNHANRKRR